MEKLLLLLLGPLALFDPTMLEVLLLVLLLLSGVDEASPDETPLEGEGGSVAAAMLSLVDPDMFMSFVSSSDAIYVGYSLAD
jgi:hypothetical protein